MSRFTAAHEASLRVLSEHWGDADSLNAAYDRLLSRFGWDVLAPAWSMACDVLVESMNAEAGVA